MKKFALISIAIIASAVPAMAGVTNGDFELGNTGFTTDLNYSPADYYPEGIYAVDKDPNLHHGSFTSFGDHTSGKGNMLIVNGNTDISKNLVWEGTTSNLAAGVYSFSFWMANAYDSNNVALSAYADSNLVGSGFTISNGTGNWTQFSSTFSTTGGVSTLALRNSQLAFSGNDFAIDDITVTQLRSEAVPEPFTMSLLGLGVAAAIKRRRA